MPTLPNIDLTSDWTNVHSATGIATGTALNVTVYSARGTVEMAESVAAPTNPRIGVRMAEPGNTNRSTPLSTENTWMRAPYGAIVSVEQA